MSETSPETTEQTNGPLILPVGTPVAAIGLRTIFTSYDRFLYCLRAPFLGRLSEPWTAGQPLLMAPGPLAGQVPVKGGVVHPFTIVEHGMSHFLLAEPDARGASYWMVLWGQYDKTEDVADLVAASEVPGFEWPAPIQILGRLEYLLKVRLNSMNR